MIIFTRLFRDFLLILFSKKNNIIVFLIFYISLFCGNLYSQNTEKKFVLNGKINLKHGSIILQPVGGLYLNPKTENNYKAKIVNGNFHFKGTIFYPSGFILMVYPLYRSGIFIIESGSEKITCEVDSIDKIPKINNKSTIELKHLSNYLLLPNDQIDSIRFLYYQTINNRTKLSKNVRDSLMIKLKNELKYITLFKRNILYDFAKKYPKSFVPLWSLVDLSENGYEPILDSIYTSLSPIVKNTYTGNILFEILNSSRITAVGHKFPSIMLTDIKNKKVFLKISEKPKFTLIDLWYSKCGPCISDFPNHKELFSKYNKDGYEVIGISVDKRQDIAAWKDVIKRKSLPWKQYLDINGDVISNKLSISLFPSNFLLDNKGTIIKKNINLMELDDFLKNNLLK